MIKNYIFEFIITFIEYFSLFFFLYECDLERPWMTIILQSIPVTIVITIVNYFQSLSFSAIWVYVIYTFLIIFICYRKKVLKKVLLAGIYLMILMLGDILTMAVFYVITKEVNISENLIEVTHPYRPLYVVTVKTVVVCIMIMVKKILDKNPVFHKKAFVFSIGIISILLGYTTTNFTKIHSLFGWIIYAIVVGMFALLLFSVHKWQQVENEKQLLLLQQASYTEFYDELKKQEDAKRRFVHDIQYHCTTLHQMLKKKEYEKGQEYLEKMLSLTTDTGIVRFTGNSNLDFMLNYKKAAAETKGITFIVDADAVSEQLPILAEDMNIIMGNLLDNAIEASPLSDSWIRIKINLVKNMILITIQNTFDIPPVKKGEIFVSGKEDGLVHGLGIRNVIERVEKNQGWTDFEVQDNMFQVKITMFF